MKYADGNNCPENDNCRRNRESLRDLSAGGNLGTNCLQLRRKLARTSGARRWFNRQH
jgi:hypothetical protein